MRLEIDFSDILESSPDASQFFRVKLDTLQQPACKEGLAKIWELKRQDSTCRDGLDAFTKALAESRVFLCSFGKLHARGRRAKVTRLCVLIQKICFSRGAGCTRR